MATPEHADVLQDLIEEGRDKWPLPQEVGVQSQLAEWASFRESDRDALKRTHKGWDRGKPYTVDPLPERIADVFPDLIFGADPKVTAASVAAKRATRKRAVPGEPVPEEPEAPVDESEDSDQLALDAAIEENELPSELQEAGSICVGEGEVWYRIYVDSDAYDYPCIEWHSRRRCIPLWRGRKALAVAFIEELSNLAPDAPVVRVGDDADPLGQHAWREQAIATGDSGDEVWRYVEIQTTGLTRNLLYQGTRSGLGDRVALTSRPDTADLPEEWVHDLDVMLAGRVTNGRKGGRLGKSQYHGIRDLLYALNESADIGRHNAKLTLRRRAVMPASAARPANGSVDDDGNSYSRSQVDMDDVYLVNSDDEMDPSAGPFKVLEYSFDAVALETYDNGLTDKILTRARVAPQLVGRATEGAATGPALKARLLDTILAANSKARAWDDVLPKLLHSVQLVMQLPEEQGGHGIKMLNADEPPSVERSSTLPEDEDAMVVRITTEVGGEILSRQTAIELRHVDWDEERIAEEIRRIDAEKPSIDPLGGLGGTAPPDENGNGVGDQGNLPATGSGGEVASDLAQIPEGAVQVFREGADLRVRGLPAP